MQKTILIILLVLSATLTFSQEPPMSLDDSKKTALMLAIEDNDLTKVKQLVENGADVNEHDFMLETPLKMAIRRKNLNMVEYLVEKGAKERLALEEAVRQDNIQLVKFLIEQDFNIRQSIVYAAENNNLAMVKLLASKGADVDFTQKRRKGLFRKSYVSPIGKAVSHNNLEMINVLIKHGVSRETAIHEALDYGKNEIVLSLSKDMEDKSWLLIEAFERSNDPIVKKLIAQGVPPNSIDNDGNSMLLIAASNGDLSKVQKCVEEYNLYVFKKNVAGENALMKAARKGSVQICSYLLEKGITVDAQNNKGETALFYALNDGSRSAFDFLVKNGADLNHKSLDGNTLLLKAAISDSPSSMMHLISLGADLKHENKLNKTAFYYVASNSDGFSSSGVEIQNTFLQSGADVNTKGKSGETLLFKSIEKGDLDRVKELVSMGADPNTQDRKGERPSCRESQIIKFLIEKGADINATDDWDDTYMCTAIKQKDLELAYYLVDKGIDVNKRCYFDEQAIIKAVKDENLTLVQFLAENGADVNSIGYFKQNVMDYAEKEGNEEIIAYLRSRGAMTKEEKNEQYKATMKLESDIKSALVAEDLQSIIALMSQHDVLILQEKVVQNIAYVAAKKGNSQMMNKLLSDDVDFDINSPVNANRQTVLFIATVYSQDELVMDLLAKGANLGHLDKNGNSAADFASKKSTKKIFKKWHN
ncbi:MAG: ankyrin repeat domain-containing protein [Crocinitomicaceae bacterium]